MQKKCLQPLDKEAFLRYTVNVLKKNKGDRKKNGR